MIILAEMLWYIVWLRIDEYLAGGRCKATADQFQQGRLSRAVVANERHFIVFANREMNVFEQLFAVGMPVADVLQN